VEVGVLARRPPATAPGAAHADPAAPVAAPRTRVRHRVGAVAALGPAGGPAQVRPHPPLPAVVGAGRIAPAAFDPAGPGAPPAPAAGAAGGTRPGDGAAAHVQDRVPRRRDHALSRPSHLDHHQGRRVRDDVRNPRRAGPGARIQPAGHRRGRLHAPVVSAGGLRRARGRDPPRGRVRARGFGEGRRGRHVLVGQSQRLHARLLPRRRPGRCGHAGCGPLGGGRRPGHPPSRSWRRPGPSSGR
jgi:hypothetical protein